MENLKVGDEVKSEIQTFFKATNIFLTGGTGAVGQVLLEKLLRSCPINNLFLLVREKKNKSPETRVNEMFSTPLFDRLKVEQPNFMHKIVLVTGDCEKPDLGLSEEDRALIVARINVVIHCAATINFNESLKRATFINIRSTRDLLILARRMTGLKVFVYVSSAFSNCNRNYIDEIIYESHIQGDTLIEMAENMSDSAMDSMTNELLRNWPNTYTFSKCIAENVVKQYGSGMPVCITRPAIVVSSYSEPFPGWMNNHTGLNGLTLGAGLGAIRVVYAKNIRLAIVPSDKVANVVISSAWHTGVTSKTNTIPVFNYVSVNMAPEIRLITSFQSLLEIMIKKKLFSKKQIWYPGMYFISSKPIFVVLFVLLQYIPAVFADIFLRFTSHKIRAVRIFKKVYKLQNVLSPFTLNEFEFNDQNVMDLIARQNDCDKSLFHMSLVNLNLVSYYEICIRGCLKYLLHEPAKPNLGTWKRVFVLHYGLIAILIAITFYTVIHVLNSIFEY